MRFKIIIIGDSSVGKTSLMNLYHRNEVSINQQSTLGMEFIIHTEVIEGKVYKLMIWDTAGQEKYRAAVGTTMRNSQGVIIVYSVTDRKSFENVQRWVQDVTNLCSNYALFIVGNKTDLNDQRVVSYEEGAKLAAEFKAAFFETTLFEEKRPAHSVRIQEVFKGLAENLARRYGQDKKLTASEGSKLSPGVAKEGGGCKC